MLDSVDEDVTVVDEDLSFELWLELLPVLVPWDDDPPCDDDPGFSE